MFIHKNYTCIIPCYKQAVSIEYTLGLTILLNFCHCFESIMQCNCIGNRCHHTLWLYWQHVSSWSSFMRKHLSPFQQSQDYHNPQWITWIEQKAIIICHITAHTCMWQVWKIPKLHRWSSTTPIGSRHIVGVQTYGSSQTCIGSNRSGIFGTVPNFLNFSRFMEGYKNCPDSWKDMKIVPEEYLPM